MRVSRVQAEENRQTVINVASRLFREHGFDGIGLKDLMGIVNLLDPAEKDPHTLGHTAFNSHVMSS
ncbi:hypothetical protein ACFQFQ_21525 [Sulfitobacter porphyrae]|uniref:HTH tetR-type domain-containing protein n=1 Tax=Sulfitobacter porphyrae TaxID=1246864 RepID=A0ABW2B7V8_9RHOB|nr:hypothetical protein GCM10007928_42080 [Sulfitobacter porphyrae]